MIKKKTKKKISIDDVLRRDTKPGRVNISFSLERDWVEKIRLLADLLGESTVSPVYRAALKSGYDEIIAQLENADE